MTVMRPADVAARVVAWHNRHPLARRIGREQVSGIGIVVLPFALPEPAPGVPHRPQALTPLFDDDWMFHAAARRLGAWSRLHGVYPLPGCEHWPLRQIDADLALAHAADARGLTGRTARHLVTALVDADGRRTRVLLSPQGDPRRAPVFGQHLLSRPRAAGLAAAGTGAGAALAAAAMLHLLPPVTPPPATPPPATSPSTLAAAPAGPVQARHAEGHPAATATAPTADRPVPAMATLAASAPEAPPLATVAGASESGPASAPPDGVQAASAPAASAAWALAPDAAAPMTTAAATQPAPAPPIDTEAVLRRPDDAAPPLAQLRPTLTAEQRDTARRESQALRATSTTHTDTAAAVPTGPVFAIATRPSRSRDDALALQAVLQGLKAQSITAIPTRLDVMAAQGRWRVVWWPHPRQEDAQVLLVEARARGLPVELIRF